MTGKHKLDDAHSSIIDTRAQATIVLYERFLSYIDKPNSLIEMNKVCPRRERQEVPIWLVYTECAIWMVKEGTFWDLPWQMRCEGSHGGGGLMGPTRAVVRACTSLASLFIFYFPISLLWQIVRETNCYGNEDLVALVKICRSNNQTDDTIEVDDNDDSDSESDSGNESEDEEAQEESLLKPCHESNPKA